MQSLIDTNFFKTFQQNVGVEVITDAGNDIDDIESIVLLLKAMTEQKSSGRSLKSIITTLYKPEQKAEIVAKILQALSYPHIPIYVGYGCDPKTEKDFLNAYPFWPLQFGIPGFTNALSLGQGKGYAQMPVNRSQIVVGGSDFCGKQDVILGLAPLTDLAKALDTCDTSRINRIILMGGYFGRDVDGKIDVTRPGYNTAVDPEASQKILCQKKIPVLIFNSQHIIDWKFVMSQEEVLAFLTSNDKTPLGESIAKDMGYYWSHKKPTPYGSLFMSDVITLVVGLLRPELIKTTCAVDFKFNAMKYHNPQTGVDEPIHMLHSQAKTLLTVTKKESSNVHVVTELTVDPEVLREQVVNEIALSLYFRTKKAFDDALAFQKSQKLSNEQIAEVVGRIVPKF